MTAEIAIVNKLAVTLAADSAGTIDTKTLRKIHKSLNKLFMLSKHEPVGIMIYDGFYFMGIPWETIIKLYRKKLDKKVYSSLKEYANSFLDFVKNEFNGSEAEQEEYFRKIVHYKFKEIKKELRDPDLNFTLFKELLVKYGKEFIEADDEKKEELFSQFYISNTCEKLYKKVNSYWKGLPSDFKKIITENYAEIIEEEIKDFDEIAISKDSHDDLKKIAIYSCFENTTGIVIAGFGEEEVFPSVYSYTVGEIYNNELKFKPIKEQTTVINKGNVAKIIPFAQREMVDAFLEGVTPKYDKESKDYLEKVLNDYPNDILEIFNEIEYDDLDKDTIDFVKTKIKEIQEKKDDLIDDYRNTMKLVRKMHKLPIEAAVINLPKDELATLAESMVQITSLKRKYTFDQDETVGGSIDVAVISKGDGFVWIKRKHYFEPNLNHHFFEKYYNIDS